MPELSQESAYQQTIRTLYERINYEKIGHAPYSDANYRLDRMRRLLSELDEPQLAAPIVHVAGTKGKGSTATFIARMLTAAGYRTGLYTSPHLVCLEERFQINNVPCSQAELVQLVEQTRRAADRVEAAGAGHVTFFELTTAVAFLHFAQQNAQAVVLEVGLGGRLDSTNICQPVACVITSIGLDHQAQLGSTISEIAAEKAGIIKCGIPLISSARHAQAQHVISERAKQLAAPLRLIDRDFSCHWQPIAFDAGNRFPACGTADTILKPAATVTYTPHYPSSRLGQSAWQLGMLGPHQADNLGAALATIDQLAELGWSFAREPLALAVASTDIPARLQIVGNRPWRVVDSAHNPDSIVATLRALDIHFPGLRRTVIFSTSRDKDIETMLSLILKSSQRLILTEYHNNQRVLPLEELVAVAKRVTAQLPNTLSIEVASTPVAAWSAALKSSSEHEVICATGSFFQASELLMPA